MDRERGKEELGQRWRQLLGQLQDQMLRACLPVPVGKVRLERGVLLIEI